MHGHTRSFRIPLIKLKTVAGLVIFAGGCLLIVLSTLTHVIA